jgi:hypothetical protein
MRRIILLLLLLFFAGFTLGACPSWKPKMDGKCNAGRTWNQPVEQDGKWREGYCKDEF